MAALGCAGLGIKTKRVFGRKFRPRRKPKPIGFIFPLLELSLTARSAEALHQMLSRILDIGRGDAAARWGGAAPQIFGHYLGG
ncbi:hypothetical protein ACFSKT_00030 [Paenibacillus xanthanilyticus]|uniref:hypothetical protein n=1 Tax=Paenibacillus xanthanilyticus TaxID=1783531 RepID=UPI003627EC9C